MPPADSITTDGDITAPSLRATVALLTRQATGAEPLVSRSAVLEDADTAAVSVVLETVCAALLTALPDDGAQLLKRLGEAAVQWESESTQ